MFCSLIGDYNKSEIRELAARAGLHRHEKGQSGNLLHSRQRLRRFCEALSRPTGNGGGFCQPHGEHLGSHSGYEQFTIGRRRGLGIAFGTPRFVLEIRPETREVVLGTYEQLGRWGLYANRTNWFVDLPEQFCCTAQIRYQHTPAACRVIRGTDDTIEVH
ncbi:MAG: tRNA methyl transferase PRC-barrel domain-containing protein [Planctomycetaceae bacterium]